MDKKYLEGAQIFCAMVEEIGMSDETIIPVWPRDTEMEIIAPLSVGMVRAMQGSINSLPAAIELIEQMEKALIAAKYFIHNGIELGYIRMPDETIKDPATKTPGMVSEALASVERFKLNVEGV